MTTELEEIMEECCLFQLQYPTGIWLEILRNVTKKSTRIFGVQYELQTQKLHSIIKL